MRLCMPVTSDEGAASPVCPHFGSAPYFMVVELEHGSCRAVPNVDADHEHGACQPLVALRGEDIDAFVVGGIGMGALRKLLGAGRPVYRARHSTVEQNLAAFKAGALDVMSPDAACAHHGRAR